MPATNAPPQYCLLNWGRLNAFPINYTSTRLYGQIGGVPIDPATQSILIDSLSVSDRLNEEPNTLIATVRGTKPTVGQGIGLRYGSAGGQVLFGGTILRVTQLWAADNPKNVLYQIEATDPTWRLNEVLVTARYRTQSASTIGADLLARFAPAGYTGAIEGGLPILDEITFTNTKLMDAFAQLASRIGGYAFCDYLSAVHLFLNVEVQVSPTPLTATHPSVAHVTYTRDLTQMVTRAVVVGGGANALARIPPGSADLPVEDATWYSASGGLVVSGPQRIAYTGVRAGGGGALVGSSAIPSGAPTLTPGVGGSITPGWHSYMYTWVSAAGETTAGPASGITIDASGPTAVPPGVAVGTGAGLAPGTYTYGVSHVLAAGETAVAGNVAAVCTNPNASTTAAPGVATAGQYTTNIGHAGDRLVVRIAYRNSSALSPATIGPPAAAFTLRQASGQPAGVAEAVRVTIWALTDTGGALYADVQFQNQTTGSAWFTANTYNVPVAPAPAIQLTLAQVTTQPNAVDTGGFPAGVVTVTVNDGGAGVTARRVYRTPVNGAQKYLLRQVSGSAQTSFVDTTADSALVTPPPAGLGALQTVTLSGIALGPPNCTGRKIYRSKAAVVDGIGYFLATIADNTTTSLVDTSPDSALGAVSPASNTSGLVAAGGQVPAGATTLLVSGTGSFPAAGGWVLSGNNRIHYTGVSGTALTGIPASGDGAILNTIPYGTPATLAPTLIGIPASGTGAIVWAILAGDPVDLLVIVDDLTAQATLKTLLGGSATGIREALIQDGRIGLKEAYARGTALLKLQSTVLETLRHRSRDPATVAGALVSVNLPPPTAITGTYRVQDVTVSSFKPAAGIYPTYEATSSSSRYTLEDLLRQITRTDPPPATGETP